MLAEYVEFWRVLPEASGLADPTARRERLSQVLDGQALEVTATRLATQRAEGKVLYGFNEPDAAVADLQADVATIDDCQDSSRAGVADAGTGERLTVGVARNHVTARLARDGDGWKISALAYPETPC